MDSISKLILAVKRGKTPFHRLLRGVLRRLYRPQAPGLPGWMKPPFRFLYELHFFLIVFGRTLITTFYRGPVFVARCSRVGKNLGLDGLPFVSGHVQIEIGDNVWIGGRVSIQSGGMLQAPRLVLKDFAEVGWNVSITVNSEVIIEEHARVAWDCRISDSDAHPRESDLRADNRPPHLEDIKPVRICRYAWVGNGTHIMKGVTIGEGAIIGANSVVLSDVPAYCLAAGNPARVYLKDFGRPSTWQAPAQDVKTTPSL